MRPQAALNPKARLQAVILCWCVALFLVGCAGDGGLAPTPTTTVSVAGDRDDGRGRDLEHEGDDESADRRTDPATRHCGDRSQVEVFEFGAYALYVPACVRNTRAVLLALGGPDTRAFVTGNGFGAPNPALEASLHVLGEEFRNLAATHRLAILGQAGRLAALPDSPASDQLLADAIRTGAALSGHPELPSAPMIIWAVSGGAPEASGFTARTPDRVAGLFLKVPLRVASLTTEIQRRVPTYLALAELDAFVDNAANTASFEANRRAGALWALAMERGVIHHSLSPVQREATVSWIRTILRLRVPEARSGRLRMIAEPSGWLGDRVTGEAWRWANYPGDRRGASWLPSRETAERWEDLVALLP